MTTWGNGPDLNITRANYQGRIQTLMGIASQAAAIMRHEVERGVIAPESTAAYEAALEEITVGVVHALSAIQKIRLADEAAEGVAAA